MPFFHIHWRDSLHIVCMTTNGLDHSPIPRAAFGEPRPAIDYAELRQQAVSPLRVSIEDVAPPSASSIELLTRLGK